VYKSKSSELKAELIKPRLIGLIGLIGFVITSAAPHSSVTKELIPTLFPPYSYLNNPIQYLSH
jgi:hypothetical protein